jgi:hypothetical protein
VAWAGDRGPDPVTGKLPPLPSTVDLGKGTYRNTSGATTLSAAWTDPDFDPSLDAFYYARVLAIQTPRWTTIQAAQLGVVPPHGVPLTVQDRAWSSPIWYTPTADARQAGKPGVTVAQLVQQGALALGDAELKAMLVGRTVVVHNTVTGRNVEILYGAGGRRLILSIDGRPAEPGEFGDLMFDRETEYTIGSGRLTTFIGGTPFEVVVYRLGDRYLAARSDEYDYANYEIQLSGP